MLTKEQIEIETFHIYIEKYNLTSFDEQIKKLFNMCNSANEVEIVKHTLMNMVVLTDSQLIYPLKDMARHIKSSASDGYNHAVVAFAYDGSPDSSQLIVQKLKPLLRGRENIKIFNSVPNYFKKMPDYPRLTLVDEFSGTGKTVIHRMKSIKDDAKARGIDVKIEAYLVAGMERARENIQNNGYTVTFFKEMKAGISGYFDGNELVQSKKSMLRLEQELAPMIGKNVMPSFGYGKAEALFFVKNTNAPNSNFPIFWWPLDAQNNERPTVMIRAEL